MSRSAWNDFWKNYLDRRLRIRHPDLFTDGHKPLHPRKYTYSGVVLFLAAMLIFILLHPTVETSSGAVYSTYRPPDAATGWVIAGIIMCAVILAFVVFRIFSNIDE